jgi:hypothetical protein
MNEWVWSIGGMFTCRGQPKSSEENLFHYHFGQYKSQWIGLGFNPDLRATMPETVHLSHDRAQYIYFQNESSAGL